MTDKERGRPPTEEDGPEVAVNDGSIVLGPSVHSGESRLKLLLGYCDRGWRIFPCWEIRPDDRCACPESANCRRPGKHPRTGQGLNDATTDPTQVKWWHNQWPHANWAWTLDRHLALDVDPRNGFSVEMLDEWEELFGFDLPVTLTQETGGGGRHLIFEQPFDAEVRSGPLRFPDNRQKVRGAEIKGVGGYVLVEPSNHVSGGRYRWSDPNQSAVPAPPGLLRLRNGVSDGGTNGAAGEAGWGGQREWDPERTARWFAGDVPPGEQRNELLSFIGYEHMRAEPVDNIIARAWAGVERFALGDPDRPWTHDEVERIVRDRCGSVPAGRSVSVELTEGQQRFAATLIPPRPPGDETPEANPQDVIQEYTREKARRIARRALDSEEVAAARGPRVKMTGAEFAAVPPPPVLIREVLAAEMNLLGGPSEAGKSLLACEWAVAVATGTEWREHAVAERRPVLWIASEGLHDFSERFGAHPAWEAAARNVYVMDEPVDLVRGDDVDWLLKEYAAERPGLVVFDLIYGMGMADDQGTRDVFPVINSLKRISKEWGAATLALGHPGHDNTARRFRGSSGWRQLTYTEWHMAGGSLTCEKSKIADKRRLSVAYEAEYPRLRWLDGNQALGREAQRAALIRDHIERNPGLTKTEYARRLHTQLGVQERQARDLIGPYMVAR